MLGFPYGLERHPALFGSERCKDFSRVLSDVSAAYTRELRLAIWKLRILSKNEQSLGQALFAIVSAVAQLERDLIRERVSAGIRNARASGKQLGRPRRIVNADEIRMLRSNGASLRQIADKLGVGYGTVRHRLRNA